MDKAIADLAVAGIWDGMTVMIGGFGGVGSPIKLIQGLIDRFYAWSSKGSGCGEQQRRQCPGR